MSSYAEAPLVTVTNRGEDSVDLQFEYPSSLADEFGRYRVTQLLFERVFYYEWNHFEFHRLAFRSEEVEFAVVELVDSPVIDQLRNSGRFEHPEARHLRISFDDHGTYDVVCGCISVRTRHVTEA